MIAQLDRELSSAPTHRNDPTDNSENAEPMLSTDPTEPMLAMEPTDPTLATESTDLREANEYFDVSAIPPRYAPSWGFRYPEARETLVSERESPTRRSVALRLTGFMSVCVSAAAPLRRG